MCVHATVMKQTKYIRLSVNRLRWTPTLHIFVFVSFSSKKETAISESNWKGKNFSNSWNKLKDKVILNTKHLTLKFLLILQEGHKMHHRTTLPYWCPHQVDWFLLLCMFIAWQKVYMEVCSEFWAPSHWENTVHRMLYNIAQCHQLEDTHVAWFSSDTHHFYFVDFLHSLLDWGEPAACRVLTTEHGVQFWVSAVFFVAFFACSSG